MPVAISASVRAPRRAAAVALAGTLLPLLAACGSSSPSVARLGGNHNKPNSSIQSPGSSAVSGSGAPSAAGSPGGYTKMIGVSTASEVALAACVRKHGVPSFPDPNAQGVWSAGSVWQTPRFLRAEATCARLLRIKNVIPPSGAQEAAQAAQLLKYSECMRTHGVPSFPDPNGDSLRVSVSQIDPNSPIVKRASSRCSHLAPGGVGLATP
jgi:hypothetical protein